MSEASLTINDGTGAAVLAQLNASFGAIGTLFYGATDPSTQNFVVAEMWWADAGTNTIWQRNAANSGWVAKGILLSDGTIQWNASNLNGAVPVANGGTAATTVAGAQANLGVPSTTGSGASGTWGINISGNAATATSATTAGTCTGNAATASNASLLQGYTASQVAGMATAISASSLSGNGYIKFSNGFIFQWGAFSISPSSNNPTYFNFTISFPSAAFGMTYCLTANTGGNVWPSSGGISSNSQGWINDNTSGGACTAYWAAWGC
jgi:hypothetical protein